VAAVVGGPLIAFVMSL